MWCRGTSSSSLNSPRPAWERTKLTGVQKTDVCRVKAHWGAPQNWTHLLRFNKNYWTDLHRHFSRGGSQPQLELNPWRTFLSSEMLNARALRLWDDCIFSGSWTLNTTVKLHWEHVCRHIGTCWRSSTLAKVHVLLVLPSLLWAALVRAQMSSTPADTYSVKNWHPQSARTNLKNASLLGKLPPHLTCWSGGGVVSGFTRPWMQKVPHPRFNGEQI